MLRKLLMLVNDAEGQTGDLLWKFANELEKTPL